MLVSSHITLTPETSSFKVYVISASSNVELLAGLKFNKVLSKLTSLTLTVKLKDGPLAAPTVVTVPLLLLASTVKL